MSSVCVLYICCIILVPNVKNAFLLFSNATGRKFVLYAATKEDKYAWLSDLMTLIAQQINNARTFQR